jgi:MacB-like periplasmic core domain
MTFSSCRSTRCERRSGRRPALASTSGWWPRYRWFLASAMPPRRRRCRSAVALADWMSPRVSGARQIALFNFVSPDWFATYGTRFVAGRDFDGRDSATAAAVVIVNETLARLLFADQDPIGQRVVTQAPDWRPLTVVGVVGDAVFHSLRMTAQAGAVVREPVAPTMYVPLSQSEGISPPGMTRLTIGVRPAVGPPSQLAASVGAAIATVDPHVSFSCRPLADVVNTAFAQERLVATLSGFFGAFALALAAIGLYGVSAHGVSQRRAEIGVRMALGATPYSIVSLILRRVGVLIGLGVLEGTVLSIWVAPFSSALLYGLAPNDPATLTGAILILSAVGLAAGWLPARRAARIEPMEVLRTASKRHLSSSAVRCAVCSTPPSGAGSRRGGTAGTAQDGWVANSVRAESQSNHSAPHAPGAVRRTAPTRGHCALDTEAQTLMTAHITNTLLRTPSPLCCRRRRVRGDMPVGLLASSWTDSRGQYPSERAERGRIAKHEWRTADQRLGRSGIVHVATRGGLPPVGS